MISLFLFLYRSTTPRQVRRRCNTCHYVREWQGKREAAGLDSREPATTGERARGSPSAVALAGEARRGRRGRGLGQARWRRGADGCRLRLCAPPSRAKAQASPVNGRPNACASRGLRGPPQQRRCSVARPLLLAAPSLPLHCSLHTVLFPLSLSRGPFYTSVQLNLNI